MAGQSGWAPGPKLPRLGCSLPDRTFRAVDLPMPLVPTRPSTCPGRGTGRRCSLNALGPYRCVVSRSRFLGRLIIMIASNGHFFTQMPHPMQSSSEIQADLEVGATSMHSLPRRMERGEVMEGKDGWREQPQSGKVERAKGASRAPRARDARESARARARSLLSRRAPGRASEAAAHTPLLSRRALSILRDGWARGCVPFSSLLSLLLTDFDDGARLLALLAALLGLAAVRWRGRRTDGDVMRLSRSAQSQAGPLSLRAPLPLLSLTGRSRRWRCGSGPRPLCPAWTGTGLWGPFEGAGGGESRRRRPM